MSRRWTHVRTVDPGAGLDVVDRRWLSLWWAALAATDETVQGGPLAPAWLRLFAAHLSCSETAMLRWRGHLNESAEMRRAFSGLYGRYFVHAVLAAELGITLFIPLQTNATPIPGGVTVSRVDDGDIPDWIAWDPEGGHHVLCEAKGRLSDRGGRFLGGKPECIDGGKAQFDRVEVTDSIGRRIATRDWIAATLWSTDRVRRDPVSLLWDPPGGGEGLTEEEAEDHGQAMRRQRNATFVARLGNTERVVRIAVAPSAGDMRHRRSRRPRTVEAASWDARRGSLTKGTIWLRSSRRSEFGPYAMATICRLLTPFGNARTEPANPR